MEVCDNIATMSPLLNRREALAAIASTATFPLLHGLRERAVCARPSIRRRQ